MAGTSKASGHVVAVLDVLHECRPPFNPDGVTRDLAAVLKTYGVTAITADR